MARKWTDEERKKQADAIRRWKPWEKSTGPRTDAGKETCKMNALKSGNYTQGIDHMRRALQINRMFMKEVEIWTLADIRLDKLINARRAQAQKEK